jgi:signal recognition particle GTPase
LKDRLIEYINRTNIDVLVIDPMGKFHNAEENSNDDMSKFMEVLNEIAETCCIAILLVHHTRKPKEGDEATYRGASTIKDSCRLLYKMRLMNSGDSAAIHVDKEDYWKYVVLECEKSNYFRQSGITILTRQTVELNNVNNFERPSLNETYILIPISNDEIKENNSDPGDDNRMLEALANSMIDSNVQSVTVTKAGQILHEQMPNKGAQRLRKMFKDILPMGSKKKIITHKGDMFLYHQESKNGRSAGIKFVKD